MVKLWSVVLLAGIGLLLAAYFMLDARRLKLFLYFPTPRPWHPHIRALLPALQRVVGGYIRGQAITSGAIFVFTLIVLTVMRVPNAVALSAIAAIADLLPLVGVYILAAVVALPALAVSPTAGLVVVGAIVLYQQCEDRVLIPRVHGATLAMAVAALVAFQFASLKADRALYTPDPEAQARAQRQLYTEDHEEREVTAEEVAAAANHDEPQGA